VLLAATTGMTGSELHVDSSFDGETCLVDGDESTLTDALLGLLQRAEANLSAKTSGYCGQRESNGRNGHSDTPGRERRRTVVLQFPNVIINQGDIRWVIDQLEIVDPDTITMVEQVENEERTTQVFEYVSF